MKTLLLLLLVIAFQLVNAFEPIEKNIIVQGVKFNLHFYAEPPSKHYAYEHFTQRDYIDQEYFGTPTSSADYIQTSIKEFKYEMQKYTGKALEYMSKNVYIVRNIYDIIYPKVEGNYVIIDGYKTNFKDNTYARFSNTGSTILYYDSNGKPYYRSMTGGIASGTNYIVIDNISSSTLHHELFHILHNAANKPILYSEHYDNYNWRDNDYGPYETEGPYASGFVSDYASTSHSEELAEMFSELMFNYSEYSSNYLITYVKNNPKSKISVKTHHLIDFIEDNIDDDMDFKYFLQLLEKYPHIN